MRNMIPYPTTKLGHMYLNDIQNKHSKNKKNKKKTYENSSPFIWLRTMNMFSLFYSRNPLMWIIEDEHCRDENNLGYAPFPRICFPIASLLWDLFRLSTIDLGTYENKIGAPTMVYLGPMEQVRLIRQCYIYMRSNDLSYISSTLDTSCAKPNGGTWHRSWGGNLMSSSKAIFGTREDTCMP